MYQASAPSKTFLLGEYNILAGGSAILINTEPRFHLQAMGQPPTSQQAASFHPQSPTYRFIQAHASILNAYHLLLTDPHRAQGGFGRSGAEFLLVYALKQFVNQQASWTIKEALKAYQSYTSFSTYKPSGADLIAQYYGQVTLISADGYQTLAWPFTQSKLCLLRTHHKVPTHHHLAELTSIPTAQLQPIVISGINAIQNNNLEQFIQAINEYQRILTLHRLTCPTTLELMKTLKQYTSCWAVKGCGALGADVLLVLLDPVAWPALQTFVRQYHLEIVATEQNISYGWRQQEEVT